MENEEPKPFWSYSSGSSRGAFGKESPHKDNLILWVAAIYRVLKWERKWQEGAICYIYLMLLGNTKYFFITSGSPNLLSRKHVIFSKSHLSITHPPFCPYALLFSSPLSLNLSVCVDIGAQRCPGPQGLDPPLFVAMSMEYMPHGRYFNSLEPYIFSLVWFIWLAFYMFLCKYVYWFDNYA